MIDTFLSFLGHGGFKLLVVAFLLLSQFAKARAGIAKKREAALRGGAPIAEIQTPISPPIPAAPPLVSALVSAAPGATLNTQAAGAASPWSNLDAFDGRRS